MHRELFGTICLVYSNAYFIAFSLFVVFKGKLEKTKKGIFNLTTSNLVLSFCCFLLQGGVEDLG